MQKLILIKNDCLKFLQTIDDNSIDLIATDPPYYKVKKDEWDRQWETKNDFLSWLDRVVAEYARVLKPTGSLYLFCSPYLSSEIEQLINNHLNVLNHIVWRKPTGRHLGCHIPAQRKFFPQTERIIFAESMKKQPFQYEAIRAYLDNAVKKANLKRKQVHQITGTQMGSHWFGCSQFTIPSEVHYLKLQAVAPLLTQSYDELSAWFYNIRDGEKRARRYFKTKKGLNTDVWDFSVVQSYSGKHPCEKPLALMQHIINTSSREGDLVLDTFVGSGSSAVAAIQLNRRFIGCEIGDKEYYQALQRINKLT